MPFCSQCGNRVDATDVYCGGCGHKQPPAPAAAPRPRADPFAGMSPRTASILCYIPVVGWVASIVVLASDRFRSDADVRFHAFQGLYLFVVFLIVDQAIGPMFRWIPGPHVHIDKLLNLLIMGVYIFMIVKTSQGQTYSLPVVGELAQRSVSER